MTSTSRAHGGCLCGAVKFSVTRPVKWVAHCHCTRCQRAHGAAFVTWVGVETAAAELDDPDAALRWIAGTEGGERGFCSACGSSMLFRSKRWPGELHIARALFDGPLEQAPQMHAFYDTHVAWASVDDGLPKKSAAEID